MVTKRLAIVLLFLMTFQIMAQEVVTSPGENTTVTLELIDGQPHWSIAFKGREIIKKSPLGFVLAPKPLANKFAPVGVTSKVIDETWKPVLGKYTENRNHCVEMTWALQEADGQLRKIDVIVRAYDTGAAVRYHLHGEGKVTIKDDNTHFVFAKDFTCWSANHERPNIGPVPLSGYFPKEKPRKGPQFPMTIELAEDLYCSVLEAAIYDMAFVSPAKVSDTAFRTSHQPSNVTLPFTTAWRAILLGNSPGDLLESVMIPGLNPPSKIEDTSWIKVGLAMWDWRAWGGKGDGDFTYGLDMPSWKRMIDFASKHNIPLLVLDAGWYGLEFDSNSNPMTWRDYLLYQPNPKRPGLKPLAPPEDWKDPVHIPNLIKYGKERNVGIVLYINDCARKKHDFEKTLKTYQEWGAAGIKFGFMRGNGQGKVLKTRKIVELCAKYKLTCNFHDGPVPPSGDRRTWPNCTAREFNHAQADAMRSFTPKTFCTTIYCNMLAGPLDMCNGFFTLTDIEKVRPKVFKVIHSTVAAEAARVMIVFSGCSFLPDTPESYEAKADLFEYLSQLPMTWDDTKVLGGKIGKHITMARRSGKNWFVSSCCDENGAELPIKLDFLEEGKVYDATLYEDAPDSHYITNKDAYQLRKVKVKKGDVIKAKLAPGGGHNMWIR